MIAGWRSLQSTGTGARFSNFLLRKLSCEFKLRGMSILHEFQMTIFPCCWMLRSHCRICIAHTDVTLTWSKVKVNVADLLNFRKLYFSTSTSSAILAWRSQLMGHYDSMGPSLQLFGVIFLNFSLSWRSRDFEVREMLISHYHQNQLRFISALAEDRSLWLWLQVGNNKPCILAAMTVSPLAVFVVHGQVTIIFVVSVCLPVCLSVCLFVCAEFFSAVFDPISIKLGHTYVICLGLVVSPRI